MSRLTKVRTADGRILPRMAYAPPGSPWYRRPRFRMHASQSGLLVVGFSIGNVGWVLRLRCAVSPTLPRYVDSEPTKPAPPAPRTPATPQVTS